jgi:hypothetical protein
MGVPRNVDLDQQSLGSMLDGSNEKDLGVDQIDKKLLKSGEISKSFFSEESPCHWSLMQQQEKQAQLDQ